MTTIIKAIYKNGVFKPVQHVHFLKEEKFYLLVIPLHEWRKQFSQLLRIIHQRTQEYSSIEIEKDITCASNELQENKP